MLLEADTSEEEPRAGCFLPEASGSRQRATLCPRSSLLLFSTRERGKRRRHHESWIALNRCFSPTPCQSLNPSQSIKLLRVVINECTSFPNRKAQVKSGAGKGDSRQPQVPARSPACPARPARGRPAGGQGPLCSSPWRRCPGAEAVPRARGCSITHTTPPSHSTACKDVLLFFHKA